MVLWLLLDQQSILELEHDRISSRKGDSKNGKAVGVALENGDEYTSDLVSGLDPKLSFLKLLEEKDLPSDFIQSIKNFRIRGSSGKVNLALDGFQILLLYLEKGIICEELYLLVKL